MIDKNWSKRELMRQANLTNNHIANTGKEKHISLASIVKICEALNCGLADVIALVPDDKE